MNVGNMKVEIKGFSAYETAFECIVKAEYAKMAFEYLSEELEKIDDLFSCEKVEVYVEAEKTICDGSCVFVFYLSDCDQGLSCLTYSYYLIS